MANNWQIISRWNRNRQNKNVTTVIVKKIVKKFEPFTLNCYFPRRAPIFHQNNYFLSLSWKDSQRNRLFSFQLEIWKWHQNNRSLQGNQDFGRTAILSSCLAFVVWCKGSLRMEKSYFSSNKRGVHFLFFRNKSFFRCDSCLRQESMLFYLKMQKKINNQQEVNSTNHNHNVFLIDHKTKYADYTLKESFLFFSADEICL